LPVAIEEMLRWVSPIANMARTVTTEVELRVIFAELLARAPRLELATDAAPPVRPANFVVGLEELPVRLAA
jgi:cytochrome P450